jgi:hypothetical protein
MKTKLILFGLLTLGSLSSWLYSGCTKLTTLPSPSLTATPTSTPSVTATCTATTTPPTAPVTLQLVPGWDNFPPITTGSVVYQITGSTMTILFNLAGGTPSQTYDLGFDIFNLPNPGISSFGIPRTFRGTYNRQGVTATVDGFEFASPVFTTDSLGNGTAVATLNLSGVLSGTYNLQFVFASPTGLYSNYQTGTSFGVGFATIVIP